MKKLVFVSNFLNHHQKPVAEEFVKIYGDDYVFIAATPFPGERRASGYKDMNDEPFVFRAYESPAAMSEAQRMIDGAECVIAGGIIEPLLGRLAQNKLTFIYSERFLKGPIWKDAIRFVKYSRYFGARRYTRSRDAKFYLLCAGAFVARDYNTCGLFRGKTYRWGYFTKTNSCDSVNRQIPRIEASRISGIHGRKIAQNGAGF